MGALATVVIIWLIVGGVCGWIGSLIGKPKGHERAGFWWGFFLGMIGWIITALLTPTIQVEANRRRELARYESGNAAMGTSPGSPSRVRTGPDPLARIRTAAAADPSGAVLLEALDQINHSSRNDRAVSHWFFNDSSFPVVIRRDGLIYFARPGDVVNVPPNPSATFTADSDGNPVEATIHNRHFTNLRPSSNARELLKTLNARLTATVDRVVAVQENHSAPPAVDPAAEKRTVGERLTELAELHTAGLIDDDEYAAKRSSILGAL